MDKVSFAIKYENFINDRFRKIKMLHNKNTTTYAFIFNVLVLIMTKVKFKPEQKGMILKIAFQDILLPIEETAKNLHTISHFSG